ncbi:MAG: hypothetical protein ACYC1D_09450 [Acidimicrobiales bacterium]
MCERCVLRFARKAASCPGCGGSKVLAFYDASGRAACATCTANPAVYACQSCGREDSQHGRRCAPCVLSERAATLLADPDGAVHAQLRPVFDALVAARRPQSVIYWLSHSNGPAILAAMARGDMAISHAAFDGLAPSRATGHVRDLLVAAGVLTGYHPPIERVVPWLDDILAGLPTDHADLIAPFARWHVLRRLRHHADSGTLSQGTVSAARATIMVTVRFLAWLAEHDNDITTLSQGDLDRYAVEHPARAELLAPFLRWTTRSAGLPSGLEVPTRRPPQPLVTLSDTQRWAQVETLLHDDSIRLHTRVAGLFTLLFAQPLARICNMRADQITGQPDGPTTVTFDSTPIELPDPLDRLVVEQLASHGQASYASHADNWLFPGGVPGRHLHTGAIRRQLVERGIHPSQSRKAALFQLAGEIPTPVLAELLGLGTNTATRWAALASRDWSHYVALRRPDTSPTPSPSRPPGHGNATVTTGSL